MRRIPWTKVIITHDSLRDFLGRNKETKRAAGAKNIATDPKEMQPTLDNLHMLGG